MASAFASGERGADGGNAASGGDLSPSGAGAVGVNGAGAAFGGLCGAAAGEEIGLGLCVDACLGVAPVFLENAAIVSGDTETNRVPWAFSCSR